MPAIDVIVHIVASTSVVFFIWLFFAILVEIYKEKVDRK